jgi:hypothetical protein
MHSAHLATSALAAAKVLLGVVDVGRGAHPHGTLGEGGPAVRLERAGGLLDLGLHFGRAVLIERGLDLAGRGVHRREGHGGLVQNGAAVNPSACGAA